MSVNTLKSGNIYNSTKISSGINLVFKNLTGTVILIDVTLRLKTWAQNSSPSSLTGHEINVFSNSYLAPKIFQSGCQF